MKTFALCMTWLKELKDIDYELGEISEITYVMKDISSLHKYSQKAVIRKLYVQS